MEVIISVGIVSFAFVGIMSVFASNIRVEIVNRDRVTASYLAQEAVEIIRQKRDTNWFTGAAWDNGIAYQPHQVLSMITPGNLTAGWELKQAGAAETDKQRIYLVDGVYIQSINPGYTGSTKFRRTVDIEKDVAFPDRLKITAKVYYGEDASQKVQIVSYLYNNWYTN